MILKSEDKRIPDYSIDGHFGKVRLARDPHPADPNSNVFAFSVAGWHSCNSLYKVSREEGLDEFLLFLTVSGTGHIKIGERSLKANAQSLVILPPEISHSYNADEKENWEFYWIHLYGTSSFSFCRELIKNGEYIKILRDVSVPAQKIQRLIVENQYNIKNTPYDNSLLVSELLHELLRQTGSVIHVSAQAFSFMNKAFKCLEEKGHRCISLDDIAKELHLSKTHTIRLFKKYTGMTPFQFIEYHRAAKGRDLIEYTDLSIKEIAMKTGFCSPSHFISAFKKIYGSTPGRIRRSNRNNYR